MKKLIALLLAATMMMAMLAGCSKPSDKNDGGASNSSSTQTEDKTEGGKSSLEGKRVRVVIGSTSTGGDSYMIADMVTRYLGEEMGFNGKVDAVGNAAALDAITNAKGDGTTIMMFHDMAFISVLFGAVGEEYALENLTVGPRIGQNPGGCFASRADAPYDSLAGAAQWLSENPDATVRVNIEAGSASHLCFSVFYLWAQETYGDEVASRIKAVVGGTTDEKKQRLWDGNTDIIYGDYSSFVEFTKEGVDAQLAMKMFDSCGVVEGVDNLDTMTNDGITFNGEAFTFNKDFNMYFPKDMDQGILEEIAAAMVKVCQNPEFQAEMAAKKYNVVSAEETELAASQEFVIAKRDTSSEIVAAAPSLDSMT